MLNGNQNRREDEEEEEHDLGKGDGGGYQLMWAFLLLLCTKCYVCTEA